MTRKIQTHKLAFAFYILLGIMGFGLLLLDTTIGHEVWEHFEFFRNNLDAIEGVLFIFVSGFNIGRLLKKK